MSSLPWVRKNKLPEFLEAVSALRLQVYIHTYMEQVVVVCDDVVKMCGCVYKYRRRVEYKVLRVFPLIQVVVVGRFVTVA